MLILAYIVAGTAVVLALVAGMGETEAERRARLLRELNDEA